MQFGISLSVKKVMKYEQKINKSGKETTDTK